MLGSTSAHPPASIPTRVRAALGTLKDRVSERFGDRLGKTVLFGSYARGEAREDSDVDVLVVIDGLTARERTGVYTLGADVWMETGVRLAPIAFSKEEWEELARRELLLADDVGQQGILL